MRDDRFILIVPQYIELCSLRNLENREETIHHLEAVCPILREFKIRYFNKKYVSEVEFQEHLVNVGKEPGEILLLSRLGL